jgi:hypothetical protein
LRSPSVKGKLFPSPFPKYFQIKLTLASLNLVDDANCCSPDSARYQYVTDTYFGFCDGSKENRRCTWHGIALDVFGRI